MNQRQCVCLPLWKQDSIYSLNSTPSRPVKYDGALIKSRQEQMTEQLLILTVVQREIKGNNPQTSEDEEPQNVSYIESIWLTLHLPPSHKDTRDRLFSRVEVESSKLRLVNTSYLSPPDQ